MNIFYLAAGLLLLFLSGAHAMWGERKIFTVLNSTVVDKETHISVYVPWHQLTSLLLLSALALIVSAFWEQQTYIPHFIALVILGNMAVFFGVCIIKQQTDLLSKSIPQTVLFSLLVILLLLGIAR